MLTFITIINYNGDNKCPPCRKKYHQLYLAIIYMFLSFIHLGETSHSATSKFRFLENETRKVSLWKKCMTTLPQQDA